MTTETPNHASYFTSSDRNYIDALWRQRDAVSPHDVLQAREYQTLIEMHVIKCVLTSTAAGLAELRKVAEQAPPPASRMRPLGPGGGQSVGDSWR